MKKPFLLILGCNYYPEAHTGDWKRCFETREEILSKIIEHKPSIPKGIYNQITYEFEGQEYDWMEIILSGSGMFSKLGEDWFDDYWMNFGLITTKSKDGTTKKITSLEDFVRYRGGDTSLIVPRCNVE